MFTDMETEVSLLKRAGLVERTGSFSRDLTLRDSQRASTVPSRPSISSRPPGLVAREIVRAPRRTVALLTCFDLMDAEVSEPSCHAISTSKPPRAQALHRSRGPGLRECREQVDLAVLGVALHEHLGDAGREGEVAVHLERRVAAEEIHMDAAGSSRSVRLIRETGHAGTRAKLPVSNLVRVPRRLSWGLAGVAGNDPRHAGLLIGVTRDGRVTRPSRRIDTRLRTDRRFVNGLRRIADGTRPGAEKETRPRTCVCSSGLRGARPYLPSLQARRPPRGGRAAG